MTVTLFRAVKTLSPTDLEKRNGWRNTIRLPANVPYVVDNLWEYLRPSEMPCRRNSVYASVESDMALSCAASVANRHEYTAYRVEISGNYKITQLRITDAREHEDIRRIQKVVQERQSYWSDLPWQERQALAMVFSPGCTKSDLKRLVQENDAAATFISEIAALSKFWDSASEPADHCDGELFFELSESATYTLQPL